MSDYSLVYRTVVTIGVGETSPKDVTLPAPVKVASAFLTQSIRESRFPDPLLDLDYRGATVRLLDEETVRIEWNGVLATDPMTEGSEEIVVAFEVYDLESLGDDLKETLFRMKRILGYLGENCVQDLISYDDPGNMVSYRLRLFDTKDDAEDATIDIANGSPLETGELSRVTITQDVDIAKNDRSSLMKVITDVLTTPGVN